jgi:hypothetical protein
MALTNEQKARLGILPHQIIEYELGQIEWYREQIQQYEDWAVKWPDHTDQFVEGIKLYKELIDLSRKKIEQEREAL